MKPKFLVAGLAIMLSLVAIWHIGSSLYEYELWNLDRQVPPPSAVFHNPPMYAPAPPLPPTRHVQPSPPTDGGFPVCDDTCRQRAVITI
jgi:hypothetical protein